MPSALATTLQGQRQMRHMSGQPQWRVSHGGGAYCSQGQQGGDAHRTGNHTAWTKKTYGQYNGSVTWVVCKQHVELEPATEHSVTKQQNISAGPCLPESTCCGVTHVLVDVVNVWPHGCNHLRQTCTHTSTPTETHTHSAMSIIYMHMHSHVHIPGGRAAARIAGCLQATLSNLHNSLRHRGIVAISVRSV